MVFSSVAYALILAQLLSHAECHIKLQKPVPYSPSTLQLSPLKNLLPGSAGSDFPCQSVRDGGADPFEVDTENEMMAGETQTMIFDGSASHGGGSCQLSVTLDRQPTANSTFKTIVSWVGGCPSDSSSGGTVPFNYTIPDEVPNGKATLAWSWVSKLSGQPEYYMNCAPITVSGGADDTSKFDELEDLFRVNLPSTECGSQQSSNLKIPNPGKYVTTLDTSALLPPTGTGCARLAETQSTQSTAGGATTPATSAQPTSFSTSASASTTPIIFSNNTSTLASATYFTAAPWQSSSASTSPCTNSTQCSPNGALVCNGQTQFGLCNGGSVVFQSVAAGTICNQGQIVAGDTNSNTTTCSPDGALVCNGEDQFGLCKSGKVAFQSVATGTTCQDGQIMRKRHLDSHKRRTRGHPHRRGG